MTLRGCASGESGKPNTSTQLAPNGAISQGNPEFLESQAVMPMVNTAPSMDMDENCNDGTGGELDLMLSLKRMGNSGSRLAVKDTDQYTFVSTDRYTCRNCLVRMRTMNTSDQIVAAALKEFYEQGFHASGVDQLSSAAGVTKRTLYRHFPSKDHLIDATLHLRDVQFFTQMQNYVESAALPDRPLAYLDFLAHWGREETFHGCAFINAAAEFADHAAAPHAISKMHKERVLEYLRSLCMHANVADPEMAANQLFLIGEGLIVTMQVMGCNEQMIKVAAQAVVSLLQKAG